MGATNRTEHYDLSQFKGTDKPSWLLDYNGDMSKIDTALYNVAETATDAADEIREEITPAVGTLRTEVDTLNTQTGAVTERVTTAEQNITSLTTRANSADNNIAALAVDKQNKNLTAAVLIDGQPYTTVEDAVRALAQYGGGDLNEYQKKTLSVPVIIDGVTYTTVESALNALNAGGGGGGGSVMLPGFEYATREVIHTFNYSGTGYKYDLYSVPKDGYYTVNAEYGASTGGSFNGSIYASLKSANSTGAADMAVFFNELGNNVNELKAEPGFLLYLKAGQVIYLQGQYSAVSGSMFQAKMEVIYTPGIEVAGGGGGGDLSAYQPKVLSSPLDVDGVQYTTVETAMAAINALAAAGGGGGTGTTNYNVLLNKPKINGVELVGDKTSAELNITGGTSNYTELSNKPQINGVTLTGNKTAADLGISGSATYIHNDSAHSASSSYWNTWQGGSTSSTGISWTTDENCFAFGVLRLARGSHVSVIIKLGATNTVVDDLHYKYPQATGSTGIDTSDYEDYIIPIGVVAKGARIGLDVSTSPLPASQFKCKIVEVDMY